MRNLSVCLLLLCALCASAQSDVIINRTTYLIADGKYQDAEQYLDSLIKVDPKNIDALMMKGNVILNYSLMETPALNTITLQDESIYTADLVTLKTPIVLVPRETALKAEALWKKCLDIDHDRLDLMEGLCSLYGMADMHKELIAFLPGVAQAAKSKGNDFAYIMTDYAQLLLDRGDREGAYETYKKIAELYPSVSGIWCLLSESYFEEGDLAHSKLYADKGLSVTKPDIAACGDALDVYIAMDQPEKVLSTLQLASKDTAFKDYPFYAGIYKYAHHNSAWRKDVQDYMQQYPVAPDSSSIYNTAEFMLSTDFHEDYQGFLDLVQSSLTDFCLGLILDRACADFKDSIQPYVLSAQACINGKNYRKANIIFASLEKKHITGDERLDYILQYSYSLYAAGEYAKSIAKWNEIYKEDKPFIFATSNYFLGQCYLKTGNKPRALEYFHILTSSKDDSKYSYLAKLQTEKMGKGK